MNKHVFEEMYQDCLIWIEPKGLDKAGHYMWNTLWDSGFSKTVDGAKEAARKEVREAWARKARGD